MIVSLTTGDFVLLTEEWDGDAGTAESLYRYLGADATVDLGAENYDDPSRWVEVGGVYQWMGTAQAATSASRTTPTSSTGSGSRRPP